MGSIALKIASEKKKWPLKFSDEMCLTVNRSDLVIGALGRGLGHRQPGGAQLQ